MRFILTLGLLSVLAASASGCKETKIVDGRIPDGYEQYAREATGTYSGRIEVEGLKDKAMSRRDIELTVSYENDHIVLNSSADWLGQGCDSKIGKLLMVETSGSNLNTAVFAFDSGSCRTPKMDNRLIIRVFGQSSGHPKLVAWVTTGWDQVQTQAGLETSYTEARATLRKN